MLQTLKGLYIEMWCLLYLYNDKKCFDVVWKSKKETSMMLIARLKQDENPAVAPMCCFYTQRCRLDKHVADSQAEEERFGA